MNEKRKGQRFLFLFEPPKGGMRDFYGILYYLRRISVSFKRVLPENGKPNAVSGNDHLSLSKGPFTGHAPLGTSNK